MAYWRTGLGVGHAIKRWRVRQPVGRGCPCVLVLVSRRLKTGSILGLGLRLETSGLGLGKLVLAPEVLVLVLYSSWEKKSCLHLCGRRAAAYWLRASCSHPCAALSPSSIIWYSSVVGDADYAPLEYGTLSNTVNRKRGAIYRVRFQSKDTSHMILRMCFQIYTFSAKRRETFSNLHWSAVEINKWKSAVEIPNIRLIINPALDYRSYDSALRLTK